MTHSPAATLPSEKQVVRSDGTVDQTNKRSGRRAESTPTSRCPGIVLKRRLTPRVKPSWPDYTVPCNCACAAGGCSSQRQREYPVRRKLPRQIRCSSWKSTSTRGRMLLIVYLSAKSNEKAKAFVRWDTRDNLCFTTYVM